MSDKKEGFPTIQYDHNWPNLTVPSSVNRMFPALTSRWIRCKLCRYSNPAKASLQMAPISSSLNGHLCTEMKRSRQWHKAFLTDAQVYNVNLQRNLLTFNDIGCWTKAIFHHKLKNIITTKSICLCNIQHFLVPGVRMYCLHVETITYPCMVITQIAAFIHNCVSMSELM